MSNETLTGMISQEKEKTKKQIKNRNDIFRLWMIRMIPVQPNTNLSYIMRFVSFCFWAEIIQRPTKMAIVDCSNYYYISVQLEQNAGMEKDGNENNFFFLYSGSRSQQWHFFIIHIIYYYPSKNAFNVRIAVSKSEWNAKKKEEKKTPKNVCTWIHLLLSFRNGRM